MKMFAPIVSAGIDFLFPREKEVVELHKLSGSDILATLPPAEDTGEKNTLALFDYKDNLVREIVWNIKYCGDKLLVEKIGEILADVIEEELLERALFSGLGSSEGERRPALVPVPISDKRRFERGWNQTELICEVVKSCLEERIKYLPNQLVKYRHTESQTQTSSKSERQKNLQASMKIMNPEAVKDRLIILLDDVTTTGATFQEAKKVLKEAGAKHVLCVAVAH